MANDNAGWHFTADVCPARAAELLGWQSFGDIVEAIVRSASVGEFWWEPFLEPRLRGCHRASFPIEVPCRIYDAFFNAPVGYRGQFACSTTSGEHANRLVLKALESLLLKNVGDHHQVEPERILTSLRAIDAKIWIDEAEVEQRGSDNKAAIVHPLWEHNDPDGQGLRAPLGTTLEVKGGWLDAAGNEQRDPAKDDRASQIFNTGDAP